MTRNVLWLIIICLFAIAGIIVLQFYWVKNYYQASMFNFEQEVNLAFEDATKKDFELRNDTIELLLVEQLMDTSMFQFRDIGRSEIGERKFTIYETNNEHDSWTMTFRELTDSLSPGDTLYKRDIATRFAQHIRLNDIENHAVFFRTQHLGHFVLDRINEYGFDTVRLRPVFGQYLSRRNIDLPFYFYTNQADSTFHAVNLPDSLSRSDMVVSKAIATYSTQDTTQQYVRAVFNNPSQHVLSKMRWILVGSLLLAVLVSSCIALLFKALFREKKVSAIKNDFIHNITHELKTPVATISAAIEAVQHFALNPEQRSRYLDHARNETKRLGRLVDSVLNISLYSKHNVPLQIVPIDIEQTIRETADSLAISTEKTVRYTYSNETDIDTIHADKALFQQVCTNILDNAIKYSGSNVCIDIHCQVNNHYFSLYITDNGEGIGSSAIPYIFEKFYREPKPHHAVKGYGLGLSYVKEIMEAHRGKIDIKSTKEKGTTVILSWLIVI